MDETGAPAVVSGHAGRRLAAFWEASGGHPGQASGRGAAGPADERAHARGGGGAGVAVLELDYHDTGRASAGCTGPSRREWGGIAPRRVKNERKCTPLHGAHTKTAPKRYSQRASATTPTPPHYPASWRAPYTVLTELKHRYARAAASPRVCALICRPSITAARGLPRDPQGARRWPPKRRRADALSGRRPPPPRRSHPSHRRRCLRPENRGRCLRARLQEADLRAEPASRQPPISTRSKEWPNDSCP